MSARPHTIASPTRLHLRVKHPKLDPDEITRVLSMTPEHTLHADRSSVSMAAETYWIAPLTFSGFEGWEQLDEHGKTGGSGGRAPFAALQALSDESIVAVALRRLQSHQDFFRDVEREGGAATLLISLERAGSMTIPPSLARKLADLGLTLELDWSDSAE